MSINLCSFVNNQYCQSIWYKFIKELGKKKVKLSLTEEAEGKDYFLQESKKAIEIKTNIETTDQKIDQMGYALYELKHTGQQLFVVFYLLQIWHILNKILNVINPSGPYGMHDQFGSIGYLHFPEDILAVCVYGMKTDIFLIGDLFGSQASGY